MTKDFWHDPKIPKILEKEYNNFKNYYILYFIYINFNIQYLFYNINDNYPDDTYPIYNLCLTCTLSCMVNLRVYMF